MGKRRSSYSYDSRIDDVEPELAWLENSVDSLLGFAVQGVIGLIAGICAIVAGLLLLCLGINDEPQ
ncbi:hypothetical protein EBZ39_05470 [bacterium]|nr:hypothetical protein [bacterium]